MENRGDLGCHFFSVTALGPCHPYEGVLGNTFWQWGWGGYFKEMCTVVCYGMTLVMGLPFSLNCGKNVF